MKKKLLVMGGILVIIFIIVVAFIFSYDGENNNVIDNKENEINDNTSINNNITNEQNINNIVFTNITCEFNGAISILEYTIINKTNEIVNLGEYEIIVKDKAGNILANMVGYLDQEIKPNEEVQTGNSIDIDLNKADSIELVLE